MRRVFALFTTALQIVTSSSSPQYFPTGVTWYGPFFTLFSVAITPSQVRSVRDCNMISLLATTDTAWSLSPPNGISRPFTVSTGGQILAGHHVFSTNPVPSISSLHKSGVKYNLGLRLTPPTSNSNHIIPTVLSILPSAWSNTKSTQTGKCPFSCPGFPGRNSFYSFVSAGKVFGFSCLDNSFYRDPASTLLTSSQGAVGGEMANSTIRPTGFIHRSYRDHSAFYC